MMHIYILSGMCSGMVEKSICFGLTLAAHIAKLMSQTGRQIGRQAQITAYRIINRMRNLTAFILQNDGHCDRFFIF